MSFDPSWSSQQLAKQLCDDLVASGLIKEKPSFIRDDREAKIAGIFVSVGLDGKKMASFTNPGPPEQLIRKVTQGEAWIDDVVAGVVKMLPEAIAHAEKHVEMDEATKQELAEFHEESRLRAGKGGGKKGRGGGRRRPSDEGCFNCGNLDHLARDCPNKGRSKGRDGDQACFNCGDRGHIARDCPEPSRKGKGKESSGRGRPRSDACFTCGESGHLARDCPER
eukprot:TRINITY_DN41150_c0_g1_i1.p1 TRINITY_DN41150_c0_g1~~TRINITY_DN41150_c0_g1_i1.p1  ORF type:complete len:253 (-),score=57.53 TRINITY_DN41150_c0_g1_i1:74-742(-)